MLSYIMYQSFMGKFCRMMAHFIPVWKNQVLIFKGLLQFDYYILFAFLTLDLIDKHKYTVKVPEPFLNTFEIHVCIKFC
jgi:hypothetical protein